MYTVIKKHAHHCCTGNTVMCTLKICYRLFSECGLKLYFYKDNKMKNKITLINTITGAVMILKVNSN